MGSTFTKAPVCQQLFVQGRALNGTLRPLGNLTDEDISMGKQPSTQPPRPYNNASGLAICPTKAARFLKLILGANCE